MIISPPSLQQPFHLVWSQDPALDRPERLEGEGDAAWEETQKLWRERMRVARELGQWEPVTRPGQTPTLFKVRPLPGTLMRKLQDQVASGALGDRSAEAMAFRIAIQSIENLGYAPVKVEMESHPDYGRIAKASIVDHLDAISPGIVIELGLILIDRSWSPPGK